MQKLLIILLFIVLMLPTLAQDEEEEVAPTIPNLTGLTAPQAEAILNAQGLRLNPVIQSITGSNGIPNTVGAQSPEAGTEIVLSSETIVTISMLQEFNLLLIYYNEILQAQGIETEHFTMINLSDREINIDGLILQSDERLFVASDWRASTIRNNECFQLWSNSRNGNHQPAECGILAEVGILRGIPTEQQFWKNTESFKILQDGVYRASCEVAAGRCELWVSPQMIAEDVTEYVYFVYDTHELFVLNHSQSQWMPLNQIRLEDTPEPLSSLKLWSSVIIEDTNFLAPNQCVIFSDNSSAEPLSDCFAIATKSTTGNNIFWRDGFTVHSTYQGNTIERNCPSPSGRSFCLIPRYDLNS
jgi:hypothetical protein